jgi:hypothetical protein
MLMESVREEIKRVLWFLCVCPLSPSLQRARRVYSRLWLPDKSRMQTSGTSHFPALLLSVFCWFVCSFDKLMAGRTETFQGKLWFLWFTFCLHITTTFWNRLHLSTLRKQLSFISARHRSINKYHTLLILLPLPFKLKRS